VKHAILVLVVLTLVYALALGSFKPLDLASGAVLAAILLVSFRRFIFGGHPWPVPRLAARVIFFFPFAAATVWTVITGTWAVALVTVGLRPLVSPGIVAVSIGERSEVGVAVSALATTLSPGTMLVDVDRERGAMLLHVIDAADPDKVRDEHEDFYQRYQKKVFP
jgi:multisubunit Na+/H+ antiporter MnhE subunit